MGVFTSILTLSLCVLPNHTQQKESKTYAQNLNYYQRTMENTISKQNDFIENYENIVIVTFDFNGGSYDGYIAERQIPVEIGTSVEPLEKSKLEKPNSTFGGWYTYEGKLWSFDNIITEDITLYAHWNWDCSHLINANEITGESYWFDDKTSTENNIYQYLRKKYHNSSNWIITSKNSTPYQPVEMQGQKFPEKDILTAIETSGVASSYGGCGPIAMMGILDYFARYYDYSSIMKDPTNEKHRIQLAYDVLKNTKTIEISNPKEKSMLSGGDKSTMTLPNDYVKGFSDVMNLYGLNDQITAQNYLFSSKNALIERVVKSIDKGVPVTLYTGVGCGDGEVSEHYVNVYGYEIHQGIDIFNKKVTQVIFSACINKDYEEPSEIWIDADVLDHFLSGIIVYTVKNENQLIKPLDFADDFVNNQGQGQYFFYEKQADITTSKGMSFQTNRLRCGYIENQYIVLSAYRENAGTAFLEMNCDFNITAMTFELGLWGGLERLGLGNSYVKLQYKDASGNWVDQINFSIDKLSTLKDHPYTYYTSFTEQVSLIRFIVSTTIPSGDWNRGRVVLGDINLFYNP